MLWSPNMEGPGMSLFQGAPSIHINNSAEDRLQEEEEIEDQKRRNEELKRNLANAFDDLEDEVSSVNSSGNSSLDNAHTNGAANNQQTRMAQPPTYVESLTHLKDTQESPRPLCETPVSHHAPNLTCDDVKYTPYAGGDAQNHFYQECRGVNGINNYDDRQQYMNNEQLKVMYEMRVKECQQLAAQTETLECEVESLRGRLAAAATDRDRAELSLQEAHHLLASSKHKMLELEQRTQTLSGQLAAGSADRERLRRDLLAANHALQEAQQRLHTLQVAHTHHTDTLFREQQDRHREEVDRLQADLMKAKNRLEEKESETLQLEKRCLEKEREKESILIEKSSTVNRLASELEAAQSRLVAAETSRMQDKSKLEATVHELSLCCSKLSSMQREVDSWRAAAHTLITHGLGEHHTDPPSPGKLSAVTDALNHHKQQLLKIRTLQEDIGKRDANLERYKQQESELRALLEEHKAREAQLNARIATLQSKVELLGSDDVDAEQWRRQHDTLLAELTEARLQLKNLGLKYAELEMECDRAKARGASAAASADADVLRELERCGAQLRDALRDNGELKHLYLQACSSRDAITRELKELQSAAQKEKQQMEIQEKTHIETLQRERASVDRLMAELERNRQELETANNRISELQREFTDKQRQFTDKLDQYIEDEKSAMRNEMSSCTQCERLLKQIPHLEEQLTQCTFKLAAQESSSQLMKELKDKAEFFQRYITRRYRQLGAATGGHGAQDHGADADADAAAGRGADELAVKTALMLQEKAIREQIADKYTLEMKTMEMNCSRRIQEAELQHCQTITTLKQLVESKAHQVDVLKDRLISEKALATQLLDAKEKEISDLIKEHNELLRQSQRLREELLTLAAQQEPPHRREEAYQHQLQTLKDQMKAAVAEHMALKKKYSEAKTIRREAEDKCQYLQQQILTLQDKYNNCKKTVFTYKDYMVKKDEHVSKEMRRVQTEYREMFARLYAQLEQAAPRRASGGGASGYDFHERITQLGEEFSKITDFKQPDAAQ